jgi:hypothetical protein
VQIEREALDACMALGNACMPCLERFPFQAAMSVKHAMPGDASLLAQDDFDRVCNQSSWIG